MLLGVLTVLACSSQGNVSQARPVDATRSPVTQSGLPDTEHAPIVLRDMGSFMFGGTVATDSRGDTFHGDHGYAQYFLPQKARHYPLIFWHGGGQSSKSWESTPDGRDGFWQIFTRRDWPVVLVDQPRRGKAGRTAESASASALPTDQKESGAWNTFRLGPWTPPGRPGFFTNSQFPQSEAAIDQFLRSQTPNTGPEPVPSLTERNFISDAMVTLFRRTGPGILVTHSLSGQYGWVAAMKDPEQIKAVVSFEPGAFAFPDDGTAPKIQTEITLLKSVAAPQIVPVSEFKNLTKMPILIIFGDNITHAPSPIFGVEAWRVIRQVATQFVETVNRYGGHATLVDLPAEGIRGNTHFAFSDLNNVRIADIVSTYLASNHLDGSEHPYQHFEPLNVAQ